MRENSLSWCGNCPDPSTGKLRGHTIGEGLCGLDERIADYKFCTSIALSDSAREQVVSHLRAHTSKAYEGSCPRTAWTGMTEL